MAKTQSAITQQKCMAVKIPFFTIIHTLRLIINTSVLGPYKAARWLIPDFFLFPDRHDLTSQNCRVSPPRRPMILPDDKVPTRINTDTRFTCMIVPDTIRIDPASIWDCGFKVVNTKGNIYGI